MYVNVHEKSENKTYTYNNDHILVIDGNTLQKKRKRSDVQSAAKIESGAFIECSVPRKKLKIPKYEYKPEIVNLYRIKGNGLKEKLYLKQENSINKLDDF